MKRTSGNIGMEKFEVKDSITLDFPLYAMAYSRSGIARFTVKKGAGKKQE